MHMHTHIHAQQWWTQQLANHKNHVCILNCSTHIQNWDTLYLFCLYICVLLLYQVYLFICCKKLYHYFSFAKAASIVQTVIFSWARQVVVCSPVSAGWNLPIVYCYLKFLLIMLLNTWKINSKNFIQPFPFFFREHY